MASSINPCNNQSMLFWNWLFFIALGKLSIIFCVSCESVGHTSTTGSGSACACGKIEISGNNDSVIVTAAGSVIAG